ncbi:hypothetical protein CR513_18551, partial [Mucuna pruriens]
MIITIENLLDNRKKTPIMVLVQLFLMSHDESMTLDQSQEDELLLKVTKKISLTDLTNESLTCLVSINNDQWTWHKKLGHARLKLISKLKKHNLIRELPSLVYKIDILCDECQKGKQVRGSFESENIVSTLNL